MILLNVDEHAVLKKPEAIALVHALNDQIIVSGKCYMYTEDELNYKLALSDYPDDIYSAKDIKIEMEHILCFAGGFREGYAQTCRYHELNMPIY